MKYIVLLVCAAGMSYLLTPLVRLFAKRAGIYDLPSERKIHSKPVPLLGGVPIFLAFNLTLILSVLFRYVSLDDPVLSRWRELLFCQIIIMILGGVDDIMHLQPSIKLIFQLIVAASVLSFGFGIQAISNPFNDKVMYLGIFSIPVTIIWVVGITNALNLVDGLDGLAAGTSFIVCITIFAISYFKQNASVALISLCLAGSILGFLRHNFYPAKIFLGDSGSLLLGFLLAVTAIQGSTKGATVVAVLAPILALGFPIMDTLLSMIRRFLRSIHLVDYPTKNGRFRAFFFNRPTIFEPDRDHVHHRLLQIGFSQRKAVVILYAICAALSAIAVLIVAVKDLNVIAVLGAISVAFYVGVKNLKYQEFKILENGLLIPIFDFPVINNGLFQAFLDLAMIVLSYYLSFVLVFRTLGVEFVELFVRTLPIVLLVKIVVFYLSSLYRGTWAHTSIEEVLTILKATVFASVSNVIVLSLVFRSASFGGTVFFILDFYLLLSFVAAIRISHRVFNSYYARGAGSRGKKVLIYGAGYRGATVLKEIRHNEAYSYAPAGFIDDAPEKIGKTLNGVPILGTIRDLDEIFKDNNISEVIVSTAKISKDKIMKITEFCRQKGVSLRQFEFRFYEFP